MLALTFLLLLLPIGAIATTLNGLKSRRNPKPENLVAFTISLLICLPAAAFLLVGLVRLSYDLYHGPAYSKSIIEKTETIATKSGLSNQVIVQGTRYTVLDSRWFQTMKPGQEIEFLYSPMTHLAYPLPQSK